MCHLYKSSNLRSIFAYNNYILENFEYFGCSDEVILKDGNYVIVFISLCDELAFFRYNGRVLVTFLLSYVKEAFYV